VGFKTRNCSKTRNDHGKSSYFVGNKINRNSHVFVIFTRSFPVLELFLVAGHTVQVIQRI
jgi:hypothetical protein